MQHTVMNFGHLIELSVLREVISQVLGTEDISIWQPGDERPVHDVFITMSFSDGEFPLEVTITDRNATGSLSVAQVSQIGQKLQSIILTDSIDTGIAPLYDDGYTMISPDGSTAVVHADDEGLDEGRLNLTPDSRRHYREAVAHMTSVAAD